MDNRIWSGSTPLRLSTPFPCAKGLSECHKCKAPVDGGFHFLVCRSAQAANHAHNMVLHQMAHILRGSTYSKITLEPMVERGVSQMRADLCIDTSVFDTRCMVDVSSKNPLVDSVAFKPAHGAVNVDHRLHRLHAAGIAEQDKINKYSARCKERNWGFEPFVLEVTGGWGERTSKVLKLIGHQAGFRNPGTSSLVQRKLIKEVAFTHRRAFVSRVFAMCDAARPSVVVGHHEAWVDSYRAHHPIPISTFG